MSDTEIYHIGDLVWAKMKGYLAWPGMIADPPQGVSRKNPYYAWIYFYGTKNYSWIHFKNIVPYLPRPLGSRKYSKSYLKACKKVDEIYRKRNPPLSKSNPKASTPTSSSASDRSTSNPSNSSAHSPGTSVSKRPPSFHESETKRLVQMQLSGILIQHSNAALGTGVYFTCPFRIGFIGLGNIGSRLVKNFIKFGYHVTIWNRTWEKTFKLLELGARAVRTPGDVVSITDITFSCVLDSVSAMNVMFGYYGVQERITPHKAYVELSTIDIETSRMLSQAVIARGGRYLEAQLEGTLEEAERGELLIFAAGDKLLYNSCQMYFNVLGRGSFFLGHVGNGAKVKLVFHLMSGVFLAGYAEALGLAEKIGLRTEDVLQIIGRTKMSNQFFHENEKHITNFNTLVDQTLRSMKRDLGLCIDMSHNINYSVPIAAIAYERFKSTSTQKTMNDASAMSLSN